MPEIHACYHGYLLEHLRKNTSILPMLTEKPEEASVSSKLTSDDHKREIMADLLSLIAEVEADECGGWQSASFQIVTGMEKGRRKPDF